MIQPMIRSMQRKFAKLPLSKQIRVCAGVLFGLFVGIPTRVYEHWSTSQNLMWGLIAGISISLAFYVLLPTTFKDHILSEIVHEKTGITFPQFLIGLSLVVIAYGYQLRVTSVWVLNVANSDPASVILGTNLCLILTLILPGYLMIPISEQEAIDEAMAGRRALLVDTEMNVIKAEGELRVEVLRAQTGAYKGLAERLTNGDVPDAVLAEMARRLLDQRSSSPKALPPPDEDEKRKIQQKLLGLGDDS